MCVFIHFISMTYVLPRNIDAMIANMKDMLALPAAKHPIHHFHCSDGSLISDFWLILSINKDIASITVINYAHIIWYIVGFIWAHDLWLSGNSFTKHLYVQIYDFLACQVLTFNCFSI